MRKRFFANLISDKIIELINSQESLNHIQTVSKGDLTTLPNDETLNSQEFVDMYFPSILVCPEDIFTTNANGNKSIAASQYYFTIRYLRHFGDNEYTNVLEQSLEDAELIADLLLEDEDLSLAPAKVLFDAIAGTDQVIVQNPCTLNKNELIKINNFSYRIDVKTVEELQTTLQLNVPLTTPLISGDVICRVTSPELPKYIELVDASGIPVGQILGTEVPHIGVDTIEQELFFKSREIPVVMINIEYIVVFRSYYIK